MMVITLPPELEQAVSEQARQQGTSPELLALDAVRAKYMPALPQTAPPEQNLAEFLGEFIGCIHSSETVPGGAQMSIDSGRKFAAGMVKKRQEGKL